MDEIDTMDKITTLSCSDYYQPLLAPLAPEAPCGVNLEYDPAFIMLQSRLQPKLGAEYGSFVEAAEPVNWTDIERECQQLLQKSRDIRPVIILMRCRLRKKGLHALAEGCEALHALLRNWPDDLYPQLQDEGEFAPILRANAFAELEDPDGLLADLRGQPLPKASGLQISIREFERAHQVPREEGALTDAAVAALVHEWQTSAREAISPLLTALHFLQEIQNILAATLGGDAPDFSALRAILTPFSRDFAGVTPAAAPATGEALPQEVLAPVAPAAAVDAVIPPSAPIAVPHAPAPVVREGITTRADALHRLQEVRSWFGMTEPGSPLIPLLKYAEASIGKSFSELLTMYPPEFVSVLNQEKE